MHLPRVPVPSDRALAVMKWLVAIGLVLAALGATAAIISFANRLDTYAFELDRADRERAAIEATNDAQADAILDQQRALREANDRCREAAGCTPVPTPPVVVPGDEGPQGKPGETGARGPGPSAAQVAFAVQSYCAAGACTGPGPTTEQVAAAVSTYCDRNGQCRGPEGLDGESITGPRGEPGAPGKDGAQGERGPGPTAEQVAAAVAEYCADGRCVGPAGSTGADGQPGAPGRGIVDISCTSLTPLDLTVTYSDGTTGTYSCGASVTSK